MKKVIRLTETDLEKIVKRVISEQTQNVKPLGWNELYTSANGSGTDEKMLLSVFTDKIRNKSDFDNLDKYVNGHFPTYLGYKSIVDVLNGELGDGDRNTLDRIAKAVKDKTGYEITYTPDTKVNSIRANTIKINKTPVSSKTTENVVDIVGKYIGGVKKSSVSGVEAAFKQSPTSRVYYIIDPKTNAKRYFQYNVDGTKLTKRGTWSIENNKIVYDKVNTPTNTSTETPPPPQNRRQYTQAPDSADVMNGSTTLKQYQMGPLVGRIQRLLGFATTDDKFGPKTLAALVSFQDKNEITDERGFVGPKTLTALERISQPIQGLASKGLKNVLPTQDNQTPVIAQNQDLGVDDFS